MFTPSDISTTTLQITTQMDIPQTTNGDRISLVTSSSTSVVTGSVVGGIAVVLLAVIILLLVMLFIQQKKQKMHPGSGQSINNYHNHINGKSIMLFHKILLQHRECSWSCVHTEFLSIIRRYSRVCQGWANT